jgi:hypothetical protein
MLHHLLEGIKMFTMPLKAMKLRTKGFDGGYRDALIRHCRGVIYPATRRQETD